MAVWKHKININHPGIYDELADSTAHFIVASVNKSPTEVTNVGS